MQRASRLKKELAMLTTEPPPGITCWRIEDRIDDLRAQILGSAGTPYEGGVFSLELKIPERYPFEPPKIRFLTPIYHPNIDTSGRICYEALKLPPKGAWRPSLNLSTLLTSIQLLMAEPNPDDPLMADIASEFRYNKQLFLQKARKYTEAHAVQKVTGILEGSTKHNVPKQNGPSRKRASSDAEQEPHEQAKRTPF
ncbi:ubiquitin-conjugating enzyme E2 T isoform X1 [Syngnathoides biaculeatus]|uniref:ubiquitin-conjugating enzyme E2 T isoform X1 n=1 Tax=Syngnathoides biaculeatus TaxID=300417 RepID=UPI002ADD713D|nr:ubiquitin-conjugating enzyme E2 T isoform X1 [Syngnathoides biaculeatus]XP_061668809.1 ubiquitin-conjugating enzyme E2 T isoform X1 [Syngnathoides biaculeatus]